MVPAALFFVHFSAVTARLSREIASFYFLLLGPFKLRRETEDNAYAKFWGDKQRALWFQGMLRYFLEWSISVQESSPTSLVGKGWIHLQHTRKAVAFAHRSFLLFLGFEVIKNSAGKCDSYTRMLQGGKYLWT